MEVEKIKYLCDVLDIVPIKKKTVKIEWEIILLFTLVLFAGILVIVGYIG